MTDDIIQGILLIGSAICPWLYTQPGPRRFYGYAFNAAIEPLWFYSAYKSGQWGVMLLAVWWAYCMGAGAVTEWKGRKYGVTRG